MKTLDTRSAVTIPYLQLLGEQEKAALARVIHDDLGGLLIATTMDLTMLKQRFGTSDPAALADIDRATKSLTAAVDIMRQVTEDLHPSLSDNVGLLSALRWLLNNMCQRTPSFVRRIFLPKSRPFRPKRRLRYSGSARRP